jgi:thioredoxin reductase
MGGKTVIIGATVAGVAAAGYAASAMFGPSNHTARVEAQDNAPATGNAR